MNCENKNTVALFVAFLQVKVMNKSLGFLQLGLKFSLNFNNVYSRNSRA